MLDKESLRVMAKWDLTNLEYIISGITNAQIKSNPFWQYFLPKYYEGFNEALIALMYDDSVGDSIEAGMKLITLEASSDPIHQFKLLIEIARHEESDRSLDNILLARYVKWVISEQSNSLAAYKIHPIEQIKADFFNDRMTLQSVYGDSWKRYYRSKIRRA